MLKKWNTIHHVDIIVVLVRGRVDDPLVVPNHGDVHPGCQSQFHVIHTCHFLFKKFQNSQNQGQNIKALR